GDRDAFVTKLSIKCRLSLSSSNGGATDPESGSHDYNPDSEVSISGIPDTGYLFIGWTGNVPSGHENDNPLTLIMDSDKSITANFALTLTPSISLSTTTLGFGATTTGIKTSDQQFRISNSGDGSLKWSVSDDKDWLTYDTVTGVEAGVVSVSVDPSKVSEGVHNGIITVSSTNASNSPQTIAVTLTVKELSDCDLPFGSFDTPIDDTSGITGAIPVTGWVLDDIGIESVKIFRNPVSGEQTEDRIYIGDAMFVEGARADVEQAYPEYPLNYQA
ncbi:unnamed protein product, partial [marine sediment metagenome]